MNGEIPDEVVLAVADLSGSMAGQPVARMNVQVSELFSELKITQKAAVNSIRFGLMGFHETKQWMVPPAGVEKLDYLPALQIGKRADGFFARSDYSLMLTELNRCLNRKFLCGSGLLNDVYVLLFTDGLPSDPEPSLRRAIDKLKGNRVFSDPRCRRYLIRERDTEDLENFRKSIWSEFASSHAHIIRADQYSKLLGEICGRLSGTKDDNVFGS